MNDAFEYICERTGYKEQLVKDIVNRYLKNLRNYILAGLKVEMPFIGSLQIVKVYYKINGQRRYWNGKELYNPKRPDRYYKLNFVSSREKQRMKINAGDSMGKEMERILTETKQEYQLCES